MPHQCTNCGRVFDDGSKEMLSGCPDCGGNKFQFHPDASDVPDQPDTSAEPPESPASEGTGSVARTVGSAAATVRDFVSGSEGPSPSGPAEGRSPDGTGSGDGALGESGDETLGDSGETTEDAAQADARSEVVSPDEIPPGSGGTAPEDQPRGTPGDATSESSPQSTARTDRPAQTDTSGDGDDTTARGADDTGGESSPDSTAPDTDTSDSLAAGADGRVADTPDAQDQQPDLSELREELNDQFESIRVLNPGQYELNLMELYDREEYIIALQEDGRYTIQVPESWNN